MEGSGFCCCCFVFVVVVYLLFSIEKLKGCVCGCNEELRKGGVRCVTLHPKLNSLKQRTVIVSVSVVKNLEESSR